MSPKNIIFIHGLESSGQGFKGTYLKNIFPHILTPDFPGTLEERMEKLNDILKDKTPWIVIGSSFGGLMAALYAIKNPHRISFLILLAPLLVHPKLSNIRISIDVPVVVFHGKRDNVVSLNRTKVRAKELFKILKYNEVDDDHLLRPTTTKIPWEEIINDVSQKKLDSKFFKFKS